MNAFQKERLGWLSYGASPPITTVGAMGDHFIDPYSAATTNPKALKILKSTDSSGRKTWYYVEHRRGIGFDSFVSTNSNVLNGIVVHTGSEASPDSSYLLDMTPETSTWNDPALTVGSSFYDAAAGVTITPISVGASGATVNVKFAAKPCVRGNPVLSVSPASRWGLPGSKQGYTVSVTNADGEGCSASSFSLSSVPPAGWSSTYDDLTEENGVSIAWKYRAELFGREIGRFKSLEELAEHIRKSARLLCKTAPDLTVYQVWALDENGKPERLDLPGLELHVGRPEEPERIGEYWDGIVVELNREEYDF